jgi:hypothetical protein
MRRLITLLCLTQLSIPASYLAAQNATDESIRKELTSHDRVFDASGEAVLLKEASEHQYFLLGELHGENEVPDLLSDLWPALWRTGYRHVAAEVSPWAATDLQRSEAEDATPVPGLWTRKQAANVLRFAAPGNSVLWGCDIEEEQPDRLINHMAQLNFTDTRLRSMQEIVSHGTAERTLLNCCG